MPINNSTSTAIFRWRPACWLRVTGDDAARFLQGQFSNDLRVLPQTDAVYGLWLTLKGKVLADSFVFRGAEAPEFWIGSYFSPAAVIRQRLESHVIADDVVIEDVTDAWAGVTVLGEGAAGISRMGSTATAVVFRGRRDRGASLECIYRIGDGEPDWMATVASSAAVLESEHMERRRIEAGVPAIPVDAGPADLPNEAGLEADAISYTKGCYLGQEVMARLKSMGQVRRRLLRVGGAGGNLPASPAPVFVGSRKVGELRSAVRDRVGGWIGLAMVTRMHVAVGSELSLVAGAMPALRVLEAP